MSWLFVLGKNPELSLAEIIYYFKNRGMEFTPIEMSGEILIADADFDPEKVQFDLGGTIKIAEVSGRVSYKEFRNAFGWGVGTGREKIGREIPEATVGSIYLGEGTRLHELNLGNFKKFLGSYGIETKKGENAFSHVDAKRRNLAGEELIVAITRGSVYFAATKAVTDPFEYQKRDVGRPAPLLLGMSPSRAGILVNLVGVPGKTLLDPFCGGGTVGQEALLRGIYVILSDIDKGNLESCRKNLEWLKKYGKRKKIEIVFDPRSIRVADARKLRGFKVDCIATEPCLGPGFRKSPERNVGEEAMKKINGIYAGFLSSARGVLKKGGRIALVCPAIRTRSGVLRLDILKLAKGNGFRVVAGPILDAERERGKERVVAREFVLLEKVIKE